MKKANIPQVLFLGNGLNIAFGGISWIKLIETISIRDDFVWDRSEVPMPLLAILATNNNIKDALQNHKEFFYGTLQTEEQKAILKTLLTMGFDDILTTNYSYELEAAGIGKDTATDRDAGRMLRVTSGNVEKRYLLHTYNEVTCESVKNRVWHIHGEIRKPDSVTLGHYAYGNLLKRIIIEVENRKNIYELNQKTGKETILESWIDSFILGDVFILGSGFGLSEVDLWWLLNRKYTERAAHGKVHFYEIRSSKNREKIELLKLMNAEVHSLGFSDDESDPPDYTAFYRDAVEDIRAKMTDNRKNGSNDI